MANSKQTQERKKHIWESSYPEGISWDSDLDIRPVAEVFDAIADQFPQNPCMEFLGKKYTYAQTLKLINSLAKGLQEAGVVKGTKVGLFLPNCPYFILFYHAIAKIGGTIINYNPLYADREVHHQIEDSQTEFMVTLDLKALYDKIYKMLETTSLKKMIVCPMSGILPFPKNVMFPLVKSRELANIHRDERHIPFDKLVRNDGRFAPIEIDPYEDIAVIQYTGGTTGVPKGAALTHANVTANSHQCRLWFKHVAIGEEKFLAIIPFFHVFAMTAVMNLGIRVAAEIVMLPRFELITTLKVIDKKKPTFCCAVPTIYNAIASHPSVNKYDLTSLNYCISGGAPLPVEVKESFEGKTGCTLVEGYGLTETTPVTNVNPIEGENKPGHIGLPIPQTIIEIISLEDGETPVPLGERGEVCVRGPQVMKGYYNKEDETKNSIRNGRFHTGDVGIMDEDGYVQIVDRIKDVILAGGFNVYPRNVEEAIYLHPSVQECVVAGIDDTYRGQTVKAYIKCHDGHSLTFDELKAFLKDKLSPIEIPKLVDFRDELPKTMIGKLSRKALLEEEEEKKKSKS